MGEKPICQENDVDPILNFYCLRSAAVYKSRHPFEHGASFSCHTRTYYKNVSNRGEILNIDSSLATCYFSYGQLDSLVEDTARSSRTEEIDLNYPNIFEDDYVFCFFPNDTGGTELAIGFDTDTVNNLLPVGIAIIDRDKYTLRRLYLHYPDKPDYKRYSRSLRFVEHEGYIFPDSIWIVGARSGLFSTEYFRIETQITDFVIYR